MALDGVFLNCVKKELSSKLIGGRVDKIYQPSREEVVFQMRTYDGNVKLVFSTSAGTARVHITKAEIENPKVPPMFCMLLRKHLNSGRLIDIRQDGLERILYFDFESVNEMGDVAKLSLAIEIMGRHSNLILINSAGKVIDSIKRVGEDMSSVRLVLPGITYSLPPREEKLSLLDFSQEDFLTKLSTFEKLELSKAIMKILEGISPVFAREAAFYAGRGREIIVQDITDDEKDRLCFYLKEVSNSLNTQNNKYVVIMEKDGQLKDFCFTEINQYGTLMFTRQMPTACELLDYFYSERDLKNRIKQRAQDLFKLLLNTTERIERRLAIQRQELKECENRDLYKTYGDLISANIYQLSKGDEYAELDNFYDENCPKVKIPLDKRLTPAQNAQKYYSEYRKADIAEKKLTELIKSGEEELAYIDSVFDALTRSTIENEILELRAELAEQGYIKSGKQKGKPPKASPPLKFISSDGFTILVGRNNKQNDKLTLKDSQKHDLWLHTHNITGSHTIIVTNGVTPPDKTIEEACMIAAYHSKAKDSAQVPVDYTLIKYVKKPVGSKPGMVIFTNNKTAYVTPDAELIEKLRVK